MAWGSGQSKPHCGICRRVLPQFLVAMDNSSNMCAGHRNLHKYVFILRISMNLYDMLSLVVEKHNDLWTKFHIGKCCAAAVLHHSPTSLEERRVNPVNPPHCCSVALLLLSLLD